MARSYVVTVVGNYLDQLINTGFQYISQAETNGSGAFALANALGFADSSGAPVTGGFTFNTVAGAMAAALPSEYGFVGLYIITPYDDNDFFELAYPPGVNGDRSIDEDLLLPSYAASSIRSNRVTRNVRRSFKRLPGLQDSEVNGNSLDTSYLNLLTTFADECSAQITGVAPDSTSITYDPAVLKKDRVPSSDPPRYEYPPNENNLILNSAIGISFSAESDATTQNSRKLGKGL